MKLSKVYNNAINITNNDPKLRKELLEEFKPLILNIVIDNGTRSLLTILNDNSISLILNNKMFSFNSVEEFDKTFENLIEMFPKAVEGIIEQIKLQQMCKSLGESKWQ